MPRYPGRPYRRGSQPSEGSGGLSNPPNQGFVAPPPVVLAPPPVAPPPPPAIIAGGAAAGAAAAGLWPIAVLAAIGSGVGLGWYVSGRIRDFLDGIEGLGGPQTLSEEELIMKYAEQPFGYTLVCETAKAENTTPAFWTCYSDGNYYGAPFALCVATWQNWDTSPCDNYGFGGVAGAPDFIRLFQNRRAPNTIRQVQHYKSWQRGVGTVATYLGPLHRPYAFVGPAVHWPNEIPIHRPRSLPVRRPWGIPFPGQEPTTDDPLPKKESPKPIPWVLPVTPESWPFIVETPSPFRPYPGSPWIVPTMPDIVISPAPGVMPRPRPRPTPSPSPGNPPPAPSRVVLPSTGLRPAPARVTPAPAPGGRGVNVIVRPNSATNSPPGPNVRERKVNIRTVAGGGWLVINVFTEALDLVDSLWEAIPENLRSQRRWYGGRYHPVSMNRRLQDIYDHLQSIDLAVALEGYINNQIEDMFYGIQGRAVGQASGRIGLTTGLNRALGEARDATGVSLQLPTIDYNPENGHVTWDWGDFAKLRPYLPGGTI